MVAFLLALVLFASPAYAGEFALGPSGQEQVVAANMLKPDAGWSIASYDASQCLQVNFDETTVSWDDDVACNSQNAKLWTAKGVTLTALRVLVTDELGAGSNGSCEFRLTTSDGSSAIAGSVLDVGPGSSAEMSEGTFYEARFNHRLAAGAAFEIEFRNGSLCGAGSSCVCADFGNQMMSVWGRY
tara:strand:- start:659 stop:1213 length:555 start_codon:yes stop_codon:yes gene_type:complete